MPRPGGYWLAPPRMAAIASSSRESGPSVSGKPWPRFTEPVRTARADISAKIVVPSTCNRWASSRMPPTLTIPAPSREEAVAELWLWWELLARAKGAGGNHLPQAGESLVGGRHRFLLSARLRVGEQVLSLRVGPRPAGLSGTRVGQSALSSAGTATWDGGP